MSSKTRLSLIQYFSRSVNNLIMTLLVPIDRPGKFLRPVFKIQVCLDAIGLDHLIPWWILLLHHQGRISGKSRVTAVEYLQRQDGTYWVMSGWRGKTDWYKNILQHPEVSIKVKGEFFHDTSRKLTDDEVLEYLIEILRINPGAIQIFSRWAGKIIEPMQDQLKEVIHLFPGAALTTVCDQ